MSQPGSPQTADLSADEVGGLSAAEVRARAARGEINVVRRETSRTYLAIVRANVLNVFNVAVFAVAALLLLLFVYTGDRRTLYDGVAICTVAVLNTLIGIIQEIRAKIALDHVAALGRSTASVIRDGRLEEIPVDEVVTGDYLRIGRGDQIPVDGRVFRSYHCEVDESLLTGESEYIYKEPGSRVLSGSFCVAGQAVIVAEKVGPDAFIHTLAEGARSYKRTLTPLQREIDWLVQLLMAIALVMGLLVVGAAVAKYRFGPRVVATAVADRPALTLLVDTTRSVASLITSLIPAGLILLSSVAFALGVFRISRRGALVQKLNAIESFAHVDVLCMDKTGTLTRNQLRLVAVHPLGGSGREDPGALRRLLAAFAHQSSEQNATVIALVRELPQVSARVRDEVPFNSQNKYSALELELPAPEDGGDVDAGSDAGSGGSHDGGAGQRVQLFLGAHERLSAHLGPEERAEVEALLGGLTGLRNVLLLAGDGTRPLRTALAEKRPLRPLAVVSLVDDLRDDIVEVLARFRERGIDLKILSGDAPETVGWAASQAGLTAPAPASASPSAEAARPAPAPRVLTGPDLDAMDDLALDAAVASHALFARISPDHKQRIVRSLQRRGHYVGMVGDGVNDVLALKQAQLGIAMGAGNRMSRDVSDIVLLDNDFSVLPAVFDEGKTILGNIQSAAKLFLTKNMYAVLLILMAGFLGLAFPFVPRHVTIIGFFAISVPALLITFTQRVEDPPPHFLAEVLGYTLRSGGVIAGAALAGYYGELVVRGLHPESARTVLLSVIVLLSLWNFLLIVGLGRGSRARDYALTAFAGSFAVLYFAFLFVCTRVPRLAFLSRFCEIRPLGTPSLALAMALTAVGGVLLFFLVRRGRRQKPAPFAKRTA